MSALTLFNQNFAAAESLLQLYQVFEGLARREPNDDLRLAICRQWEEPDDAIVHFATNDRVTVLARAVAPLPGPFTTDGGLDFLLRQAVVISCTCLDAFVWDVLRENILTVVRARRSKADESIRNIKFTLADYISLQDYEDPDFRLQQLILKNYERGTLYGIEKVEEIAKILTVEKYWENVGKMSDEAATLKRQVGELIARRNKIAHRADRPDEDEKEKDAHGLRPIHYGWVNGRVQAVKNLVTATSTLVDKAMKKLRSDLDAIREQEEARRLASGAASR